MINKEQFPHTYEGNLRVIQAGGFPFDTLKGTEIWYRAQTLQQLGEANALWLEGRIGHMPTCSYYSHPNDETIALLPYINPLNRSGLLVSTFSQPGCTPRDRSYGGIMDEQRAALSGFMSEDYAEELKRQAEGHGVTMLFNPAGSTQKNSFIVVSRASGNDISYTGNVLSTEDIAKQYGGSERSPSDSPGLNPNMIKVLQNSCQVDLYDPEWGRNDKLWPMLQNFFAAYCSIVGKWGY